MKNLVKKTILAVAAFVLGLGATHMAMAATGGDVWSVMPCDESGKTITDMRSVGINESIYVRIRLWNQGDSGSGYYPWAPAYAGAGSTDPVVIATDWANYKPRLGIFTRGADTPEYAELLEYRQSQCFTDLIFKYKVKPGDFALPVDIAVADTSGNPVPSYEGNGTTLYFDPSRTVWTFKPVNGSTFIDNPVTWAVGTPDDLLPYMSSETSTSDTGMGEAATTAGKGMNTSFISLPGYRVETVHFADIETTETVTAYSVALYDEEAEGLIALDDYYVEDGNGVFEPTTFYVWSTNEQAVVVTGDNVSTMVVDVNTGEERQVAELKLTNKTVSFGIYAVSTEYGAASLVLSPTPHYGSNKVGVSLDADVYCVKIPLTITPATKRPEIAVKLPTGVTSLTADGDRSPWTKNEIRVEILNARATNDFTVALSPRVGDADPMNWTNYVFFSTSSAYSGVNPLPVADSLACLENCVIAKGDKVCKVYAYALRTDQPQTTLTITPLPVNDTDQFITGTNRLSTAIKATVSAESLRDYSAMTVKKNRSFALEISVSDAYADEQDGGYEIQFYQDAEKAPDGRAADRVSITGLALVDGVLMVQNGDNSYSLPMVEYTTTDYTSSVVRVISPHSKIETDVPITVKRVESNDTEMYSGEYGTESQTSTIEVNEAGAISVNVRIPDAAESDLYVFLVNTTSDDITTNKLGATATFIVSKDRYDTGTQSAPETQGVEIPQGDLSTPISFSVLDNPSEGTEWVFEVVACTTASYSAATIYPGFSPSSFTVKASNVSAKFETLPEILLYGENKTDLVDFHDGASLVEGPKRYFKVFPDDSTYDLETDFRTRWTFIQKTSDGTTTNSWTVIGNPVSDGDNSFFSPAESADQPLSDFITSRTTSNDVPLTAGDWTVIVQVLDKDDYAYLMASINNAASLPANRLESMIWSRGAEDGRAASLTANFTILDSPAPAVTFSEPYWVVDEGAENAYVTVSNTWWDAALDANAVITGKVTVAKTTLTKSGNLTFILGDGVSTNGVDADVYYLEFTRSRRQFVLYIDPSTLDGSSSTIGSMDKHSNNYGFNVTVEMEGSQNLPTVGKTVSEYYQSGQLEKSINVRNLAPAPNNAEMHTTGNAPSNSWAEVALNRDNFQLNWAVYDVNADINTEIWSNQVDGTWYAGTGVWVRVYGENVVATNFYANNVTGLDGTLWPEFNTVQSETRLYIALKDKDGLTWTSDVYYFAPQVAKMLTTVANMPSGGNAMIPLSTKYASSKGVGYGHTWVSGGERKFDSAENFYLSWNCGTAGSTEKVYAFGYKVGDVDNGELSKIDDTTYDVWIGNTGNRKRNATKPDTTTASDKFYNYVDGLYDSYFYGWIKADEPGGEEYTFSASPQMGTNQTKTASIKLPTEKTDDGQYVETYIEAVFSREHNQYDQMGDINDDGIPDYYMLYSNYANGALATVDNEGGELAAINAKNDDDDYYPSSSHTGVSSIAPGAVSGWATKGAPFTAEKEIRGYHEGLNFGMFQFSRDERVTYGWISELCLSELEKKSLLREVLERRDYLLKTLYTTGKLNTTWPNNEVQELALVTNLLAQIYYKGAAVATGDDEARTFYTPRDYVDANTSSDIERVVVNQDTGTNDTISVDAWLRTFTQQGADKPTVITNYVNLVAYTNVVDDGTTVTTNITYLTPSELYSFDEADIGNWLNKEQNSKYADQQRTAKAYIDYTWRKFTTTGEWGWTCENRTDPTTDDTDGDGMPDGYEYYMWYAATVGAGTNQLTGCKFNLGDLEDYDTVITPKEIASIYNPNISTSWTSQDTDGDGIYDLEEFLIGTSPVHWDTDRDGLSDLYEVMYNMNPLDAGPGNNAAANGDGDFMAFWKATADDELGKYEFVYVATNGTYWLLDTEYSRDFGGTKYKYISAEKEYIEMPVTGEEPVHGIQVVPFNGGYIVPTEDTENYAARNVVEFTVDEPFVFDPAKTLAENPKNKELKEDETNKIAVRNETVSLYHHQVHNYFGFDPRTGWYRDANGSLSSTGRWLSGGAVLHAGAPVNTSAYSAINEYLLLKYRYAVGLRDYAKDAQDLKDNKTTIANIISAGTTNPSADFSDKTWGDDTTTYARSQHGADTDGDAVPDGWELYIGVDPNRDWTIAKGSPGYDPLYHDGGKVWTAPIATSYSDGLTLAMEYAGTDSCGGYEACSTIYANHPSNGSGWFNKFFPTDPRNDDTDGDGVSDGEERCTMFTDQFTFNRWGQTVTATVRHSFIYGNPSDSGSKCIRGGGMNPCSIDTDGDGLPDPWERQYAGLLFHNNDIVETVTDDDGNVVRRIPEYVLESSTYDDIRAEVQAHWGIYTNEEDSVYHIMLGMDPTYDDATSPVGLTGTDRDWDGDGLQNWQEYMVQAMRHLRYDDSRTPLLGRDIDYWDAASQTIKEGTWNGDSSGYLRFSYLTPFSNDPENLNALIDAGYENFAAFIKDSNGKNYLAELGYFADPPKSWDYAGSGDSDGAKGLANKYMLPPKSHRDVVLALTDEIQMTDEAGAPIWEEVNGGGTTYTGDVVMVSSLYFAPFQLDEQTEYWGEVTPLMTSVTIDTMHSIVAQGASKYVGTDPRLWDTDGDGMDDYYELFHGLNPLLGSIGSDPSSIENDVIANAYGTVTAWQNAWVGWENETTPPCDPIKYPWMMGIAECDADGDGLRNNEEMLLANVTSPNAAHTDPTPLWMTDNTVDEITRYLTSTVVVTNYLSINGQPVYRKDENGELVRIYTDIVSTTVTNATLNMVASPSYTKLYYVNEFYGGTTTNVTETGNTTTTEISTSNIALSWGITSGTGYDYLASFEMNEGYDTDNDWRTDSGELKSLSRKNSDPLDFSDPTHRQSVWFGGTADPGALIAYTPTWRKTSSVDLFKQFTVEAWIKPEAAANGEDQYIVSRASYYNPWELNSWEECLAASDAVIRMNFALGVDAYGRVFAETQNSTELTSRVTGDKVDDGVWVHVAATYDGHTLSLYRNGTLDMSASTAIIPANGTIEIEQNPQNAAKFPYDAYSVVPSTTIIGARAIGPGAFGYEYAAAAAGWDDVATDFYNGSVAEVRTWDGARTAAQIASDYNVSYSIDDLKSKRLEFYAAWRDGATRNENDGRDMLPAELIQYYNMATLPGATDAAYVRIEPTGFAKNVLGVLRNPDDGAPINTDTVKVGWWNSLLESAVGSGVYTSGHVVPWVQNMVAHLPRICGSVADSVYWSEHYAGYTPATTFHGLDSYVFPNTMNPYTLTVKSKEDEYLLTKYANMLWHDSGVMITEYTSKITNSTETAAYYLQYRYDYRMGFAGTTDLLPVGSAFAKRSDTYWDGQGAETAWQETGVDDNANDLPDWWENSRAGEWGLSGNITADSEADYKGSSISAYQAYLRDLAAGWVPSGDYSATKLSNYLNREDFDNNGLPDWWTDIYGVKGGAFDDDDNDGLSNYTEFLLSEYFNLGVAFSPVKAKSISRHDSDYFFKIGQLYTGEIFTDHDFVEDVWEDVQGWKFGNRYAWDANQDTDEDGWSNFAERRYSNFTSATIAEHITHVESEEFKDMPIPVIKLTLRYNDDQPIDGEDGATVHTDPAGRADVNNQKVNELANYVIQTFTRQGIVVPDATFIICPGQDFTKYMYLGAWKGTVLRGYLSPGYIQLYDFNLQVLMSSSDTLYKWVIYGIRTRKGSYGHYLDDLYRYGSENVELLVVEPEWQNVSGISISKAVDSTRGSIMLNGVKIGTINTQTGEFLLDTSMLEGAYTENDAETPIDVELAAFRFNYHTIAPTLQSNKVTFYLTEPNTGYVKEGKNTIVAYLDNNTAEDFTYTDGEPLGMTEAEVGWYQCEAEIDMTDTSPIITRADLVKATSDRAELYGTEAGDYTNLIAGTISGGRYERVRVVRTLVNGFGIDSLGMENRVIFDKVINLDQRSYFYEGDVLENGGFDIDWDYFQSEVMNNEYVNGIKGSLDPIEVTYRIVLGNGTISEVKTNNLYSIATVRHFDAASVRTRPVVQAPGSQSSAVFGARPTFKWTMKMVNPDTGVEVDNNSYTAFRVQVLNGSKKVYDSGVRRAPATDLKGVYTFVPDVYVGDILEPSVNYKWRVAMYNSKFQPLPDGSEFWSDDNGANTFRVNALTNTLGTLKICARYFGPSKVLDNGEVRIEAFETPDFTGDPVARTYVRAKDTVAVSDTEHVMNATLIGLTPGKYYVRGYVDLDSYGTERKKDTWESWGYVCNRDASDINIFTPTTIVIDDVLGQSNVFDLYIEDVDTNGNCLPDAWEIIQNKGKLDNGTENINDTLDSGIEINQKLADDLQNMQNGSPAISGLAAYVFSVLGNSGVAALVLDADTASHSSRTLAAVSALTGSDTLAEATDVNVDSLESSDGSITLFVSGEASAPSASPKKLLGANTDSEEKSGIYSATAAAPSGLSGTLEYVADLSDVNEKGEINWKSTGKTVNIKVNKDGSFTTSFTVNPKELPGVGEKCFFHVNVMN